MVNAGQKAEKRELDDGSRKEALVWRWIRRALVIFMVAFWLFKGLEPGWRWLALVAILLGANELIPIFKKEDNERSFSISLGKNQRSQKTEDNGGAESSPVSTDRSIVGSFWPFGRFTARSRYPSSRSEYCSSII